MSRQCIYQLIIFKQKNPKFSQDSLLYFIFKSLKINCCKLWTAASYFWTFSLSIFKAYESCYFSINAGFLLTKKKTIIRKKSCPNTHKIYINIYIYTYLYIYIYINIYIYTWNIIFKNKIQKNILHIQKSTFSINQTKSNKSNIKHQFSQRK